MAQAACRPLPATHAAHFSRSKVHDASSVPNLLPGRLQPVPGTARRSTSRAARPVAALPDPVSANGRPGGPRYKPQPCGDRTVTVKSPMPTPRRSDTAPPQVEVTKHEHILLAIIDSNPALSSASRTALSTAAALAARDQAKLTVLFVDDAEERSEAAEEIAAQRIKLVQGCAPPRPRLVWRRPAVPGRPVGGLLASAPARPPATRRELTARGVSSFDFAEETVEHSVGKGSVAVGARRSLPP